MTQLKLILLIDDMDDFRRALRKHFVMTEEFKVVEAVTGANALQQVKGGQFDLMIIDVGLSDTNGRDLCRKMRKQGLRTPIIMLTRHATAADTILGLDAGANDYVTKSFKFPVLLARIRAQLRQHEQSEDAVIKLGPYSFRLALKVLIAEDDSKIRLTEKETNIPNFCIERLSLWCPEICCCKKFGAIMVQPLRIRLRPTSIVCVRKLN